MSEFVSKYPFLLYVICSSEKVFSWSTSRVWRSSHGFLSSVHEQNNHSPRVRIGRYSDETAKVKKLEIGHVDVSHETDMRLLEGTKKASLSVRAI
jgi:hypothetical protein